MDRTKLFFIVRVTPDGAGQTNPEFSVVNKNYLSKEFSQGFDFTVKFDCRGHVIDVAGPVPPSDGQLATMVIVMSGWIASFMGDLDFHGVGRYESVAWFAAYNLAHSMPLIFSKRWYGFDNVKFEFRRESELDINLFDCWSSLDPQGKMYFNLPLFTTRNYSCDGVAKFIREYYRDILTWQMNMVVWCLASSMRELLGDVSQALAFAYPGRIFSEEDIQRITTSLNDLALEIPTIQVEATRILPSDDRLNELSAYQGSGVCLGCKVSLQTPLAPAPYLRQKLLEYALGRAGFFGTVVETL